MIRVPGGALLLLLALVAAPARRPSIGWDDRCDLRFPQLLELWEQERQPSGPRPR